MIAANSANFPLLVSRIEAGTTISKALRLFIGRGRRYSVEQIVKATGVPKRRLEPAMCCPVMQPEDWRPLCPEHIFSLSRFLGAEFVNEFCGLSHVGAFDLPSDDTPPAGKVAADSARDHAEVAELAADGSFQGDERALRVIGERKIERGMQLVAMSRRAAA